MIRNKTRKLIKEAWDRKIGSLVDKVGSNGITVGRKFNNNKFNNNNLI